MSKKYLNFGVGWVRSGPKGEFIACKANGEMQKVKMKLELEDGTELYPDDFFVNFSQDKKSEKSPDVSFSAVLEE